MKDSLKDILLGFVLALFLIAGVWGGYKLYPSLHPCNDTAPDTVFVFDTIDHHIPDTIPWYVVKLDTVIYRDTVFKDVDTAAILRDYYAPHYYERSWTDSLISVDLKDVIAENRSIDNIFTYKLIKPQQIIVNEPPVIYSRYLTVGAGMPFKSIKDMNLNIDLVYVMPKWYIGIGYNSELNCPTIKGGATILKLR